MNVSADFSSYVINLDRDIERRHQANLQISQIKDLRFQLVRGVPGSTIPRAVRAQLVDDGSWIDQKGALGCFLSHVSVWERIAATEGEFGVVLEDDANFGSLQGLQGLGLPADADIVFLNDRMCSSEQGALRVVSLLDALKKPSLRATGAGSDGYLLTRVGAAKLLSALESDLFYGHIDGRLLRYATNPLYLSQIEGTEIHEILLRHHNPRRVPKLGLLIGYTLSYPLVFHLGIDSTRDLENTPSEMWLT